MPRLVEVIYTTRGADFPRSQAGGINEVAGGDPWVDDLDMPIPGTFYLYPEGRFQSPGDPGHAGAIFEVGTRAYFHTARLVFSYFNPQPVNESNHLTLTTAWLVSDGNPAPYSTERHPLTLGEAQIGGPASTPGNTAGLFDVANWPVVDIDLDVLALNAQMRKPDYDGLLAISLEVIGDASLVLAIGVTAEVTAPYGLRLITTQGRRQIPGGPRSRGVSVHHGGGSLLR